MHINFTVCLFDWWYWEDSHKKEKCPYIHIELFGCLHYLNLRKAYHGIHYSKLKSESQFINIFRNNYMHTFQWSRIYWSRMICVQFYLLSLFVWWGISVAVCLIVGIIKAQTEVAMRISIALESTLLAWWLTHLLLTTSVTWL